MKRMRLFLSMLMVLMTAFPSHAQLTPAIEQALNFKDYAQNGGFENGTGKWKTYADAAGAQPIDCSAGSPSVSLAASTTSPIQGKASGVLTKPASNVQGQGYAMDFAIDKDAKAKMLSVSASYEVVSGTYSGGNPTTDSDLTAYIYDVDGGQIIQPIGYKFDGAVTNNTYNLSAMFQTPSFSTDSRNLRLCLHYATTSASANALRLDKVKITGQTKSTGYVKTAPVQYSPTWTGLGTVSNNSMYWQRDGGDLILWGYVIVGSPTNNAVTFTLPAGLTIDLARLSSNVARRHNFGYANRITNGSTTYSDATAGATMAVVYQGSGSNTPQLVYTMVADAYADVNATSMLVGGNAISIPHLRIPIAGWDVGTQVSDQFDGRVFAVKYSTTSTAAITSSASQISYATRVFDTHGAFSGTTFTAPSPGFYRVTGSVQLASTPWTTGSLTFDLYKNGSFDSVIGLFTQATSSTASVNATAVGSTVTQLNAGDTLTFRASQNQTASVNLSGVANYNYVAIERISGISQVQASEKIYASYTSTSGQSIPNNSATTVLFGNKLEDTHSVFNTANGQIRLPKSGAGYINVTISYSTAASGTYYVQIFKNGSLYKSGVSIAATTWGSSFSGMVSGLAGDIFDIRTTQNSGGAKTLDANPGTNHFDFRMD